ncbi:MAG TPA: OB-fold nucleic acid binding domain-containing protein, partial [Gaiellaceae bacterium]
MSETDDRRSKLGRLRSAGIEPYPHAFPDVTPIAEIREQHNGIEPGEELSDATYRIGGRLAQRRGMGGATFIDLVDRSGKVQLHAKRDDLGDESFDTLTGLDLGDVIGADGFVFKSRRGELSLR